jgi:hypothetical protein
MRFELVWNEGTEQERREPLVVSEADIDDAVDYLGDDAGDTLEKQARSAAYRIAVERGAGRDELWSLYQDGKRLAANH